MPGPSFRFAKLQDLLGTDFEITAGHFNARHEQIPVLSVVTLAIAAHAKESLRIEPMDSRFAEALAQLQAG